MKRKHQDPLKYSRQHTQERALERYGYTLSDEDYTYLCAMLKHELVRMCWPKEEARFEQVNREGNQYTLIVPFRDQTLVVVYDTDKDLVTTVLPPDDFADYLHN